MFKGGHGMLFRRKRETRTYDRETQKPVIRASICTGERVAGFRDDRTGRFEELMLIRDEADLREFLARYSVDPAQLRREW